MAGPSSSFATAIVRNLGVTKFRSGRIFIIKIAHIVLQTVELPGACSVVYGRPTESRNCFDVVIAIIIINTSWSRS